LEILALVRKIYVAGAGYVGLVTAACYAQAGNLVSVYEKDKAKRRAIASGKVPFFEPSLDQMLAEAIQAGRLEVVANPARAVASSDISFVAVGTPTRRDGTVDLAAMLLACRDIAGGLRRCSGYHVLAIRSTVFPGTTSGSVRKTVERFSVMRAGEDFGLVAFPEFLREGSAIHDTLHPDRLVLGEFDYRSGNAMEKFVRDFYGHNTPPILRVSCSTAELIKCASNAFLATKIAFINEIANLCERLEDTDVGRVADGMGYDDRIGRAFLDAGIGFGGSCLPKDLKALVEGARRNKVRLRIAEAAFRSNQLQPLRVVRLARELISSLKGKKAAVLGLAFKPKTSDMRDATSLKVVEALLKAGMSVTVYDPVAMENAAAYLGDRVRYADNIRDCLEGAHCCFIVTEWDDFRLIPSNVFTDTMAQPVVIDGRGVLDHSKLSPRIAYKAIGLGKSRRKLPIRESV
jgi:UDPglucose 6-dehydrogenase